MVEKLGLFLDENPVYKKHKILERMVVPERIISFRVIFLNLIFLLSI